MAEIRRIASAGEVVEVKDMEFGRKYTVCGELIGAVGTLRVLTVWIQKTGHENIRLVTVRPE